MKMLLVLYLMSSEFLNWNVKVFFFFWNIKVSVFDWQLPWLTWKEKRSCLVSMTTYRMNWKPRGNYSTKKRTGWVEWGYCTSSHKRINIYLRQEGIKFETLCPSFRPFVSRITLILLVPLFWKNLTVRGSMVFSFIHFIVWIQKNP